MITIAGVPDSKKSGMLRSFMFGKAFQEFFLGRSSFFIRMFHAYFIFLPLLGLILSCPQ
jgi:hypothetical protein